MTGGIEIMNRGTNCLLEKSGVMDTERFIAVINREKFDYTKWQREGFDNMTSDVSEVGRNAGSDAPGVGL